MLPISLRLLMLKATAHTYQKAFSGLSKETWLLSVIMLVNRSGTMVVPFLTLYLTSDEMGYSISQAGIVFGLFGFGAFTGAYFGGKLTDKIGFYPVQLVTLLMGGLLFFVLGQMKTYPLICLFTYLLSFFNEAFRPANSTAIAFYSKEENRTRSYSLNRLAINIGWALGSSLGGVIAHINYELLFWVDGFTNIAAAIIMWLFLKPVNYKAAQHKKEQSHLSLDAYKDKTYLAFILLTVLFASCFFQLFTNLPVFFRKELHFSEPVIGFLNAINGIIIAIIEMALIYRLDGKRNNLFYITIGVFIVGASLAMLNIPGIGILLAFVVIILVTVGEMLAMPFMNSFWISRSQHSNRGQYAALYTMAWSAAQTLGPMGGARVADKMGFNILWWSMGGICFIASFFFYRMLRQANKKAGYETGL
jgi:predicted MFS family arabinose efflux permease